MDKAVDAFVDDKVQPEHRPVVEAFRALIRKVAPEVREGMRGGTEVYYGIPVYRLKRDIIGISPTKKGVNFAFSKGVLIEDRYGLLEGRGKVNRNVFVRNMDEFNAEALADYIGQAVKIDLA